MIWKLLAAVAVAWLGWRFYRGFGRVTPRYPAAPRPAVEPPERREARVLLGVPADAGPAEIRAAHRRLVADTHPDRGGSGEMTRRLNAARDLLLRPPE